MSKLIIKPNLPEGRVEKVIIGNHPEISEQLGKIGIESLILKDNLLIDFSVRNHADMAACYLGEGKVIIDKKQKQVVSELEKAGFKVFLTEKEIAGEYPDDVALNSAIIGNNHICNPNTVNNTILAENSGKCLFSVKQGYSRCSVCPVTESAFITDDTGIYNKTKDNFDVLLIEKGDILLEGKDYGFIGGASAKIDNNTILFFGNLSYHRNAVEIESFLAKYGVKYISLTEDPLRDIGGIVSLTETE